MLDGLRNKFKSPLVFVCLTLTLVLLNEASILEEGACKFMTTIEISVKVVDVTHVTSTMWLARSQRPWWIKGCMSLSKLNQGAERSGHCMNA